MSFGYHMLLYDPVLGDHSNAAVPDHNLILSVQDKLVKVILSLFCFVSILVCYLRVVDL